MPTFVVIKHSRATIEADSREEALDLAGELPDAAWEDTGDYDVESEAPPPTR